MQEGLNELLDRIEGLEVDSCIFPTGGTDEQATFETRLIVTMDPADRNALVSAVRELDDEVEFKSIAQRSTSNSLRGVAQERDRLLDRIAALEQQLARLRSYHRPGCPAVADDDSDSCLADFQTCACGMDELERQLAELHESKEILATSHNVLVRKYNDMEQQLAEAKAQISIQRDMAVRPLHADIAAMVGRLDSLRAALGCIIEYDGPYITEGSIIARRAMEDDHD